MTCVFNWKITAATVYCEDIDDEVTLLVLKDGSAKCVSCQKYGQPDRETVKTLKEKRKRLNRQLSCKGSSCKRPVEYRDKLLSEESGKK